MIWQQSWQRRRPRQRRRRCDRCSPGRPRRLPRISGATNPGSWCRAAAVDPAFGHRRAPRFPTRVGQRAGRKGKQYFPAGSRARRAEDQLFELFHDALAQPVLAWVQDVRIAAAARRQFLNALGLVLIMVAVATGLGYLWLQAAQATRLAQLQEARAVATLASQATQSGDAMTGMLAALAVLPDTEHRRPLSIPAEMSLLEIRGCAIARPQPWLLVPVQCSARRSARTASGW